MKRLGLLLALPLTGCANIPAGAEHPLVWWVGLTLGGLLLSASWFLVDSVVRRHGRRDDRRDRRDERGPEPKS